MYDQKILGLFEIKQQKQSLFLLEIDEQNSLLGNKYRFIVNSYINTLTRHISQTK